MLIGESMYYHHMENYLIYKCTFGVCIIYAQTADVSYYCYQQNNLCTQRHRHTSQKTQVVAAARYDSH